jgi:hypothetical protein
MKITRKQLRKLIESFISGPRGTIHVPDKEPYSNLDPMIQSAYPRSHLLDNPESAESAMSFDQSLKDDSDINMQTGEDLTKGMTAFDDPHGEYDRRTDFTSIIKNIETKYQKQVPDLFINHPIRLGRYSSLGKPGTYANSNIFSVDEQALMQIKSDLEGYGLTITGPHHDFVSFKTNSSSNTMLNGIAGKYYLKVDPPALQQQQA